MSRTSSRRKKRATRSRACIWKYGNNNEAVIEAELARILRPGCRVYVRRTEIPRVAGRMGINILTTPKGVMTGRQARREGLGFARFW